MAMIGGVRPRLYAGAAVGRGVALRRWRNLDEPGAGLCGRGPFRSGAAVSHLAIARVSIAR